MRAHCALLRQHPCLRRDPSARSSLTGSARPPSAACQRRRSPHATNFPSHRCGRFHFDWSVSLERQLLLLRHATLCSPGSVFAVHAAFLFAETPFVVGMRRCLVHFQRFRRGEKLLCGYRVLMPLCAQREKDMRHTDVSIQTCSLHR